jgi:hypothetical protein
MAFDWREYLAVARLLVGQAGNGCTPEAGCRGAVSKAYYVAFNHARQYATSYLGVVPRTRPEDRTQDHGRLRAHLLRRRRHRVSDALHTLRELRNACDYVDDLQGLDFSQAAAEYVFNSLAPPAPGP